MHFLREVATRARTREQAERDYRLGASVKQDFSDRVALLLTHGASSSGRDFYNKRTHLENALLLNDLVAKRLVDHGAPTPVLSAGEELRVECLRDREEQVRRLATAVMEGRDDETTLIVAAQQGNLRAVRLCLDVLGVSVDATNDEGLTAPHAAACNGRRLIVDELLSRGASLTIPDAVHHGTPLDHAHWAARTWPSPERADVAQA
jgi:ankyrin repeat protein